MRAAEEWRWTQRRFKGAANEFSGDSGIGEGSMHFHFEGLGSGDIGVGEELTRVEGKLTA